ncbi:hypothetical protein Tco_1405909 [Tanacetum coccineum]
MTDPPPPQAHTEHVNAVFTESGKSDYSLKILKDPPPPIIIESHKSSIEHPIVNDFVVINIPEEDVEPKEIILDPDDQPMWESAKTVAPTPNSAIVQPNVDDNFVINSTHLKMISENKFDGILRADPHDHIREFLAICNMFRYGETQSEAIKLYDYSFFLFLDGYPLRNPDANTRGIFLYKSPNQAFKFLEDKAMDSQFQSLKEEMHEMRNKYQDLRDNHDPKNNMNDDTPMCKRRKANYIQSEGNKDRNSHDSSSRQSLHDPNDSKKLLKELNNDVRKDLEDFKNVSVA